MSKYLKWGIVGAAILAVSLFGMKACDLYQSRGILLGELNMLKAQAKAVDAKAKREIAAQVTIIETKDAEIVVLTTAVGHANRAIGQLQESYGSLEKQYANASTAPEKLTIALGQIINLKGQISENHQIIQALNKTVDAWSSKFDAQVAISLSWESQYSASRDVVDKQDALIRNLNTSLRISRLTGSVKSVAFIAASAYILLKVVKVI